MCALTDELNRLLTMVNTLSSNMFNIPYIRATETTGAGVNGSTYSASVWNTIALNTMYDSAAIASFSGSNVVLPAGRYRTRVIIPELPIRLTYGTNYHFTPRIRDTTNSITLIKWEQMYTNGYIQLDYNGEFELTSVANVASQLWLDTTLSLNNFANDAESNVWSTVEFWKLA